MCLTASASIRVRLVVFFVATLPVTEALSVALVLLLEVVVDEGLISSDIIIWTVVHAIEEATKPIKMLAAYVSHEIKKRSRDTVRKLNILMTRKNVEASISFRMRRHFAKIASPELGEHFDIRADLSVEIFVLSAVFFNVVLEMLKWLLSPFASPLTNDFNLS